MLRPDAANLPSTTAAGRLCPKCWGDGTVDFNRGRSPEDEVTVRCPACHGIGTLLEGSGEETAGYE